MVKSRLFARELRIAAFSGLAGISIACAAADRSVNMVDDPSAQLKAKPARVSAHALKAAMLGVAKAGKRIVAVGDHGVVLLSDDGGKVFRQATSVPVSSTLTGVSFVDDKFGWAVGHWGVVLQTSDGGESWKIQRIDTKVDQPLLSVHFKNRDEGVAVGLWSLVLVTRNGGKLWEVAKLAAPPGGGKADKNLYSIFAGKQGALYVTTEQGTVLRSEDDGRTWTYQLTGYKGTFWTGIVLDDGTVLVGGLRGTIYLSKDRGNTWESATSNFKSSITGLAQSSSRVVASALDGVSLESVDGGKTFTGTQRDDRLALTAIVANDAGRFVVFLTNGPASDLVKSAETLGK